MKIQLDEREIADIIMNKTQKKHKGKVKEVLLRYISSKKNNRIEAIVSLKEEKA